MPPARGAVRERAVSDPVARSRRGCRRPGSRSRLYPDRDPAVPDNPAASAVSEPSPDAAIPVRQSVVRPGPDPEPVLRIVPLGSGLILIGLGLGLAFLALRVRRG